MTSTLVRDVRAILTDADRPLTAVERVQLLATLARPGNGVGADLLDELDDAIADARRHTIRAAAGHTTLTDAAAYAAAVRRLLAAGRAVLDHTPDTTTTHPGHSGQRGDAPVHRFAPEHLRASVMPPRRDLD